MARYTFTMPPGWIGQRIAEHAVQLQPIATAVAEPPPDSAALIFLLPPVAPASLWAHGVTGPERAQVFAESLNEMVTTGCADARILHRAPPLRIAAADAYPGASVLVWVELPTARVQGRVFILLDAEVEWIPLLFLGEPAALPQHMPALALVLSSLRRLPADPREAMALWES